MLLNLKCLNNSCDIIIKDNIFKNITDFIDLSDKVIIVTDSMIPSIYFKEIITLKPQTIIYKIPASEINKNIDNYQNIINVLLENQFSKTDSIIAIGGGVVGDLAGFVAGTYKRGIRYINIPTSLLAMIDSSIGGKTAIDFNGVKNVVGMYYFPEKVLISLNCLETLPERHFYNGLMEALKCGYIGDKKLYDIIASSNKKDIHKKIFDIVSRSIDVKKRIVEVDPFESGKRRILNFGHTLGHAIESVSSDLFLHGEAVALGMLPFVPDKNELRNIIEKYLSIEKITIDKKLIYELIKSDKKWINNMLEVVLVKEIGQAEIIKYTEKEIEDLINEINFW